MSTIEPIKYFDDADFDPFTVDEQLYGDTEDVYALIDALRETGPVGEGSLLAMLGAPPDSLVEGMQLYYVIGHAEVEAVLRNPQLFSNDVIQLNLGRTFGDTITAMNPPRHTKVRKNFQRLFHPNQIAEWNNRLVGPVLNGLVDKFAERHHADLVEEFAKPYPFEIIYRQLDLPEADIEKFHKLAVSLAFISDFIVYGIEASEKLEKYFSSLIAQRRSNPGEDLVSLLINVSADGERLSDDVVISFLRQLINAAGDTTYRSTGSMLIALLTIPGLYERVLEDRSLVPAMIEETLRWNPPIVFTERTVMEDTVLGGVRIPAGAILDVSMAAANNDPAIVDEPRRFDLDRANRSHFGFGRGPHMCVGQHLARLEMTRALNIILDRLPNLRLDPAKPAPSIRGVQLRTPRGLHVLFD